MLKSFLDGEKNIKIFWDDLYEIKPNRSNLTVEMLVDKLSLNFLDKIKNMPLVDDVVFYPRVGSGGYGINLLFKVVVTFEEL